MKDGIQNSGAQKIISKVNKFVHSVKKSTIDASQLRNQRGFSLQTAVSCICLRDLCIVVSSQLMFVYYLLLGHDKMRRENKSQKLLFSKGYLFMKLHVL